jgi:hypothetical protein
VYVGGVGVALNEPRATLDVSGQSSTEVALVQSSPYADGIEEAPPNAKPSSMPGARILSYTLPIWKLVFYFDQPCDPDARYRLMITGITIHGREVQVPPVDFVPYREWRPMFIG